MALVAGAVAAAGGFPGDGQESDAAPVGAPGTGAASPSASRSPSASASRSSSASASRSPSASPAPSSTASPTDSSPTAPTGTPRPAATGAPRPTGTARAPAPAGPGATAAPAADAPGLVLTATGTCWYRIRGDGVIVGEGTLRKGQTRRYDGAREYDIILGNAGGVQYSVAGSPARYRGEYGTPLRFTVVDRRVPAPAD
nr:DUF4115 domain-containing protein [Motilibacter aurantiacus]